jgi:hypothetical protein
VVSLFVAITDDDWFAYLAAQPQLDEVNFWQPRGKAGFQAISRGELFLFKLHSPRNYIVGGGIFERASSNVPLWLAWDSFGTRNGAATFEEMRERISRYTHARADDCAALANATHTNSSRTRVFGQVPGLVKFVRLAGSAGARSIGYGLWLMRLQPFENGLQRMGLGR